MPYVAAAIPTFVHYGPGKLYVGPEGTTEPTDLSTALNVAWKRAGYTDNGHTFTRTPTYENIEVAESYLPVAKVQTGVEETVEFAYAEILAANLQTVLNGATVTASGTGATAIDKIEPLAFGATEVRVALLWEADDASERWVWRRVLQTGAMAINRQKGAAKATIPATFSLEPPASGAKPWMAITKSALTIT